MGYTKELSREVPQKLPWKETLGKHKDCHGVSQVEVLASWGGKGQTETETETEGQRKRKEKGKEK